MSLNHRYGHDLPPDSDAVPQEKQPLQYNGGEHDVACKKDGGGGGQRSDGEGPSELRSPEIDGVQGWIVVGIVFVTGFMFTTVIFGFNILYVEFSAVFNKPKAELGWVGSMEAFTESVIGVVAGVCTDKFGARPVFLTGALLMSGGSLASAFAPNVPTLYITYGVLVGCGYGCIQVARSVVVACYFDKYRALAIGLSQTGICVGSVATPMLVRKLIDYFGWRGALIILAGILLQAFPLLCLLRPPRPARRPRGKLALQESSKSKMTCKDMWSNFTDFSLLHRMDVIMYCLSATAFAGAFYTYVHHLPSRVVAKGYSLHMASMLPTYLALSVVPAKILASVLANCNGLDVAALHTFILLLGGVDMLAVGISSSVAYMIFNAVVFGVVIGWFYTTNLITLVEFVGPEAFARAQGISMLFLAPLSLTATPFAGWLYDVSGDYDIPFYVTGSLLLISGGLLIPVCIARCRAKHKKTAKPPVNGQVLVVSRQEPHKA